MNPHDTSPSGGPEALAVSASGHQAKRLIGIDAARGLALIGLMAAHILPDSVEATGEPTLAYTLFAGHSAALFAVLAAMGSMTLTIYSAHLIALIPKVHYDEPGLWFILHVGAAAVFAWFWNRLYGRGALEWAVTRAVSGARIVAAGPGHLTVTGSVDGGAPTGKPPASPPGGCDRSVSFTAGPDK